MDSTSCATTSPPETPPVVQPNVDATTKVPTEATVTCISGLGDRDMSENYVTSHQQEQQQQPFVEDAKQIHENETTTTVAAATIGGGATSENVPATTSTTKRPWDYSNRKVVIYNIMKFAKAKEMEKLVHRWMEQMKQKHPDCKIAFDKIKKPPRDNWLVITLKEEAMCQPFVDFINQNEVLNKRGGRLVAKRGEEDTKRTRDDAEVEQKEDGDSSKVSKRSRRDEIVDAARRPVTENEIRDKITPLWQLSKEEQKAFKMRDMINKCSAKIIDEMKKRFREKGDTGKIYAWLKGRRSISVDDLVSAPTPLRNKCEFTFGYRYLSDQIPAKGNQSAESEADPVKVPAVGFMVRGWAGGVSRPHHCHNIPPEVCQLVDVVDNFLGSSPLPPYDTITHKGFWRLLTVRTSRRTRECMVVIMHAPASGGVGDGTQDPHWSVNLESERNRLVTLLSTTDLTIPDQSPLKVTSIFFQEFEGLSLPPPEHPVQHVYGKLFLTEILGKCTFQISPGAFFQVNTEGAEILYRLAVEKVKEVAKEPEKTLLFDVCCGTGTIGITCMKEGAVGQVVGVDISEPAIADAKRNAEINGYPHDSNTTRFIASRAEHVLHDEINQSKRSDDDRHFAVIVDPARDGLHPDVIRTIRINERIERVVYVSCNPTGTLVRDALLLCQPPTKKYSGRPFKVTSAKPVDMFPLTDHCEMVMTFDRLSNEELPDSSV